MLKINNPIVLVGIMGAGKTSFGKKIAKNMNIPFFDSDHVIEKQEGMSVSNIFKEYGEEYFRNREYEVIKELMEINKICVIALGGGAFVNDKIRNLVKNHAISVWIKADIDVLLRRVSGNNKRPLLENGDKREILLNLLQERNVYYSQTDIEILNNDIPYKKVEKVFLNELEEYYGK